MKTNSVPKIRFKGFTDDWEQRKFPEFVEFYNGLTYSPDDVRASGTLVLRSSNVKNGEIVDADNVYVEPDKATSENVKEGDIIVVVRNGSRALIGKHAEIKESMSNTVIGAFMSGIRSEHSSFVNALLDTNQFEKEIEKNMGATINQITGYMFSKMEFTIPSPTEQDKIGNYFKYLDHLITLHQRKCEQTKELKKFMLQKMFPKKGEKNPEIRFPGFTDDWEQRKAGEIFKSVSDKGYTDLPVLSASQELGMILRDEIGIDIKYDESSIKNYKRVKPGQFVIHLRSFQGGFAWSDIEGITSPAYTILDYQEPEEHCSKFWKIVLTSPMFITRLETVTYGIRDGRSISFTDFSTLNLNVPSIAEQQKIGEYFSKLDNLITLHQRKLFEAKNNPKNGSKNFFRKIYQKLYKFDFNFKTYDWEQRKLGEIAEFNPKSDLPDEFEYVDLESVVGTEMVFHRTENKASAPSRAQRVAKTGDVFFQTVRPYQRNNYLFSMPYENYVFSTGYAQMRPKINAAFLMCFLQTESFVQNVLDNCTGTSYPVINSSDLSNLKISLPILKSEQSKIGKLISNLDHLITLHQREVFYTLKHIFYRCCDTLLSGGL